MTKRAFEKIAEGLREAIAIARGEKVLRTKTKPFDTAEYLDSPEAVAAYLNEAFATGDKDFIAKAVGSAARAKIKRGSPN